jgi:hypothetical protein
MVTIFETQLLCVMGLNYYVLMLGLCVLASVSGNGTDDIGVKLPCFDVRAVVVI